jgi:1,4-dihydroxy-2-naphthoate octaprenyltransferase
LTAVKSWLKAFRLRTLPLALATIAVGSFLAAAEKSFNWAVLSLSVITTLFLQILSNLSNDYGDTVHGADSQGRVGPERAVQSGAISLAAMKRAMMLFASLAFVSGITLIYVAFRNGSMLFPLFFLFLGQGAIAAAIKYTAGENPYGYRGLGDLFVFLFFGIVGVAGSYFLYTRQFPADILLPAASVGFLCTGVLNVNNMRDRISDAAAGKLTMAVRLGETNSKYYHFALVLLAWILIIIYSVVNFRSAVQFIYLISAPFFVVHLVRIFRNENPALLDPQLKSLVLSTLFYCITFGIGQLLSA